jgi:soluble cytochrome b562
MRMFRVVLGVTLIGGVLGCQAQQPQQVPTKPATGAAAFEAKPHGTLAQVMRGIPFPNSNIIFDTQTIDPAAKGAVDRSSTKAAGGATGVYASVYGGWQQVENSAVALSETANLLMIPGRVCENGLPVPIEQEAYRKAVQGLVEAGQTALKAARSKNIDAMVDASGTVSDACAACHEKYRDVPDGKMRCVPVP